MFERYGVQWREAGMIQESDGMVRDDGMEEGEGR